MQKDKNIDNFRARINRIEEVKKLADELKSSPTSIVNFLVDTGIEVLNRSKEELKVELRSKLLKLLK